MNEDREEIVAQLVAWFSTREYARKVAGHFPLGAAVDVEGERGIVIGYPDKDMVTLNFYGSYEKPSRQPSMSVRNLRVADYAVYRSSLSVVRIDESLMKEVFRRIDQGIN